MDRCEFAIEDDWLVTDTGWCTCGASMRGSTAHDPGCGWEKVARLDQLPGWAELRARLRRELVEEVLTPEARTHCGQPHEGGDDAMSEHWLAEDEDLVVAWVNPPGQLRWQPTVRGAALYWHPGYDLTTEKWWTAEPSMYDQPQLYRSRKRAIRVARRRERTLFRREMNTFIRLEEESHE